MCIHLRKTGTVWWKWAVKNSAQLSRILARSMIIYTYVDYMYYTTTALGIIRSRFLQVITIVGDSTLCGLATVDWSDESMATF